MFMDNSFVSVQGIFDNQHINVMDIETGLKFLFDDILTFVNMSSSSVVLYEAINRTVLIDGNLCEKLFLIGLLSSNFSVSLIIRGKKNLLIGFVKHYLQLWL